MANDIFNLEQKIFQCWHVLDDIEMLSNRHSKMSEGELSNTLRGLQHVYQMKFEDCFTCFEQVCKEYHERGRH